jgi:molecular chaperone HscB
MAAVDYFEVLGLPRRFAIEAAELERRYLDRSREVHPDRQSGASAAERVGAAGRAMQVNQAYRTLRRELSRAEHLLALEGVVIGDNQPVAPELLAEMLELREELAEARQARDQARLTSLEGAARRRERVELDRLGELFAGLEHWGGASQGERSERLGQITRQVVLLRYLARYREAFEEEDE